MRISPSRRLRTTTPPFCRPRALRYFAGTLSRPLGAIRTGRSPCLATVIFLDPPQLNLGHIDPSAKPGALTASVPRPTYAPRPSYGHPTQLRQHAVPRRATGRPGRPLGCRPAGNCRAVRGDRRAGWQPNALSPTADEPVA